MRSPPAGHYSESARGRETIHGYRENLIFKVYNTSLLPEADKLEF